MINVGMDMHMPWQIRGQEHAFGYLYPGHSSWKVSYPGIQQQGMDDWERF